MAAAQGRLEDVKLVGVHGALDNVLAQPPGASDEHHVAKAGLGVECEAHAAASAVGAHHFHHAHRLPDLEVVDPAVGSVGNGTVHEQAGEALSNAVQQLRLAGHVQEGLMLACEAGVRQVFGGRGAAHGGRDVPPVQRLQPSPTLDDLADHVTWKRRLRDDVAGRPCAHRQVVHIAHVYALKRLPQAGPCTRAVEHLAVRIRGDGEAAGHPNA